MFVISWVNPDEQLAAEELRRLHARGPARSARRHRQDHRRGPRSTRSATASAARCSPSRSPTWRRGSDERIASATFLTTQVDFTYAGDLKVFAATEEQIESVEREMAERGYLEGAKMATAFNLLRSNDLIWPYVVNNYLKGEAPFPFDLLYWNSDATRMPAANHSFYLRNCYLENNLAKGKMDDRRRSDRSQAGHGPDLQSRHPRGPHRAGEIGLSSARPASAGRCASCCRAPAISPAWSIRPARTSTSTGPASRRKARISKAGSRNATEHPGSWWTDWIAWIKAQDAAEVAGARARRRRAHADRGRAGELREGAELRGGRRDRGRLARSWRPNRTIAD